MYRSGRSGEDIKREMGIVNNKLVPRVLKAAGVKLRSRSESNSLFRWQKAAA
jgi:hypothetical protein